MTGLAFLWLFPSSLSLGPCWHWSVFPLSSYPNLTSDAVAQRQCEFKVLCVIKWESLFQFGLWRPGLGFCPEPYSHYNYEQAEVLSQVTINPTVLGCGFWYLCFQVFSAGFFLALCIFRRIWFKFKKHPTNVWKFLNWSTFWLWPASIFQKTNPSSYFIMV